MTERNLSKIMQMLLPMPRKIALKDADFITVCEGYAVTVSVPKEVTGDALDLVRKTILRQWNVTVNVQRLPLERTYPPEGYGLSVDGNGIKIAASGMAGVHYALSTLRQLSQPARGTRTITGYILPQVEVEDEPALAFRGLHICWFPETTAASVETLIRLAAYYKMNYIVLEPWGVFPFECEPDFVWRDKVVPRTEFRRILDLAKSLGLTVIPQLNLNGHAALARSCSGKHFVLNQHPEYAPIFEPNGWCWCLTNPETRKILTNMVTELHEFFGNPPYFHIGCDEAPSMGACATCAEQDPGDLLQQHIMYFTDLLKKRGARPLMWHDMLLDSADPRWDGYVRCGTAESGTLELFKTLPRDIVICDWQYCSCVPPRELDFQWESSKFFMDAGFDTMLCPFETPANAISQARYMWKNKGFGILGTTWHTCYGPVLNSMISLPAGVAWNPERHERIGGGFARHVREVQADMGLTAYEDFGYLNHYQIPIHKVSGLNMD